MDSDDYSHKIEVNSDANSNANVSNREYEQRLQDSKRSINLLNPQYLTTFIEEFNNLVRKLMTIVNDRPNNI